MRLIWINGPFGVGKSTASLRVATALGATEFDPELIGGVLRRTVSPAPDDFQSLVSWQLATVGAVRGLLTDVPDKPLVLAMTVYRPEIRQVLREAISDAGVPALEVVLTADEPTIRHRLNKRARGPFHLFKRSGRDWALARAAEAIAAFQLDSGDLLLDTTSLSADQVSTSIVKRVANG